MYIYIYADINIFMHATKSNRNEKLKEWDKNIYNRHYDPPTSLQWIKFTVVSGDMPHSQLHLGNTTLQSVTELF